MDTLVNQVQDAFRLNVIRIKTVITIKSVLKDLVKIHVLKEIHVASMLNVDQKIMKPTVFACQIILVMQKFFVMSREQLSVNLTLVEQTQCVESIQIEQLDATVHHSIQMEIRRLNVNHLKFSL